MEKLPLSQIQFLRTLIVDDDSFSLRIIRHILYGLGVEHIEEAFNGEGAIEHLNHHKFDLLITDIEMPKLNGLELVKRIRCGATRSPRTLATIVITNFSETELLGPIVALDVNGFLTKPIKHIWVHEKITKAMTEGGYIQPVANYEAVDTRLGGQRSAPQVQVKQAADTGSPEKPEVTAGENGKLVFVRNLKAGMELEKDIHLKDGTLLLKKGYKITESTINRLYDLQGALQSESISIRVESAATIS